MALKDKVPSFEKGSPDLGAQLRAIAAVVFELCEAEEARLEASKEADAATTTKTTSRAATKAVGK